MSRVGCAQTAAVTHITPLLCKYTAEETLLYSINASQNLKLEENLSMRREKKLTARAHPVSYLLFFSSNPTRREPSMSPEWKPRLFEKRPQLVSDGEGMQSLVFRLKKLCSFCSILVSSPHTTERRAQRI